MASAKEENFAKPANSFRQHLRKNDVRKQDDLEENLVLFTSVVVTNGKHDELHDEDDPNDVIDADKTFEQLLNQIGPWGLWQHLAALMNMIMTVVAAIQTLSYPMLVGKFEYWCDVPGIHYDTNQNAFESTNFAQADKSSPHAAALLGMHWSDAERRNFTTNGNNECTYYARNYSAVPTTATFAEANRYVAENFQQSSVVVKSCGGDADGGPGKWIFSSKYFDQSLRNEFLLICDRMWLEPLVHTSFTIGSMIGVLMFGWFSDRYGRRKTLRYAVPLLIATNFALAAVPNMICFLIVRFLQGLVNFGMFTVVYIISMETTSVPRRPFVGNLVHIPWGFNFIAVAVLAYFIRNWRWLQLCISLPSLLTILFLTPLLSESPRWLIFRGRQREACDELERAMLLNKSAVHYTRTQLEQQVEQIYRARCRLNYIAATAGDNVDQSSCLTAKTEQANLLTLFRTPEMRRRTILLMVVWFQGAMTNHGINFYAPKLAENPLIAYGAVGFGEILAPTVGAYLFQLGRRIPIAVTYLLGALTCFIMLPCLSDRYAWLPTGLLALTVIGTFLSDMGFNGVYVHSSELFPTVVRNLGVGMGSSLARVGSSLSSFIVMLHDYPKMWWAPPSIFGVAMLAGSVCTLLLPSTENIELPETVADVEQQRQRYDRRRRKSSTTTAVSMRTTTKPLIVHVVSADDGNNNVNNGATVSINAANVVVSRNGAAAADDINS